MSRLSPLFIIFISILYCQVYSQQNSTLFFMHSTPQANIVNPAVRNDCGWMLGLPVLSSLHLEYGNSVFRIHDVLKKQTNDTYLFDGETVMRKLGKTNYLTTEFHTNLFYLGFWVKDNFFTFSVNEKADIFLTYPRDAFALAWKGNTQFEGKTANLGHTAGFLNYRHEFALGVARESGLDLVWGVKAKFLFGVVNSSMPKSSLTLYTNPGLYELTFSSDWKFNTTLPVDIEQDPAGNIQGISYNGKAASMLFSFKNIGAAFDAGFIKQHDNNITIAGSILDIGLVRWSNNSYGFRQKGEYLYNGPLGDTIDQNNYVNDFLDALKNEFGITASQNSYISFLNPMYYLGATYKLRDGLNTGAVLSGRINRYRVTSGLTLSMNKTFNKKASVSLSWSYLYRSLNNFGLGVKLGQEPLQFYMVTDNVIGLIKPLDAKNINARFGLQFNFGCHKKPPRNRNQYGKPGGNGDCGCSWIQKEETRRARYRSL